MFTITDTELDPDALKRTLVEKSCGACVSFEGWVRDHHEGRAVEGLEYEVYAPLAISEGERILAEARQRFGVDRVLAVHRQGHLGLRDIAVWVGVASAHRDEAFSACRYIIDQVKLRLPIWKKEHYVDGQAEWVNCQRCQQAGEHT